MMINRVAEFLNERKMTAYGLAKVSGVGVDTIYRLQKDPSKLPNVQTYSALCATFNCQPGEFIRWVPNND